MSQMHDPAAVQAKLNHWLRQRGCQNFLTCLVADRAVLVRTMLAHIAELNGAVRSPHIAQFHRLLHEYQRILTAYALPQLPDACQCMQHAGSKAALFSFALHLGGLVMLPLPYLESLLLLASAGPP